MPTVSTFDRRSINTKHWLLAASTRSKTLDMYMAISALMQWPRRVDWVASTNGSARICPRSKHTHSANTRSSILRRSSARFPTCEWTRVIYHHLTKSSTVTSLSQQQWWAWPHTHTHNSNAHRIRLRLLIESNIDIYIYFQHRHTALHGVKRTGGSLSLSENELDSDDDDIDMRRRTPLTLLSTPSKLSTKPLLYPHHHTSPSFPRRVNTTTTTTHQPKSPVLTKFTSNDGSGDNINS